MAFIKKIKVGSVSYDVGLSANVLGSGLMLGQSGEVCVSIKENCGLMYDGCSLIISGINEEVLATNVNGVKIYLGTNEAGSLVIKTGSNG